ncbi:HD domain-containing protein [Rhizobium leguminosarum]|uniref:HD domain-containing protein n=1 Tax=Rhizobium leguminosarum TaxID=384 RepID=UPI0028F3EDEE|nr:HD domain-containing protein [Rhizobium leguminosarum]
MNSLAESEGLPGYSYLEPVGALLKSEPFVAEISSSAAFQRLKDIRFLGSIDYWLIPSPNGAKTNVRYTRYQHSLGVARLAMLYADIKSLSEKDRKVVTAAALLHDIGHAPFSHSVESLFEAEFGINHHLATNQIIRGEIECGFEIRNILKRYDVDPEYVIAILSGQENVFDGFFSGPINFDTIEGILRSRDYMNAQYISPRPTDILIAAINRNSRNDRNIVDSFWRYKHEIYQFIVRSPGGVLADHLAREAYKRNLSKINKADFFSTEKRMIRRIHDLREVLFSPRSAVKRLLNRAEPISYSVRNFSINSEANFFDWDDKNRYTQSKDVKLLYTYFISAELVNKGKRHSVGSVRTGQNIFKY